MFFDITCIYFTFGQIKYIICGCLVTEWVTKNKRHLSSILSAYQMQDYGEVEYNTNGLDLGRRSCSHIIKRLPTQWTMCCCCYRMVVCFMSNEGLCLYYDYTEKVLAMNWLPRKDEASCWRLQTKIMYVRPTEMNGSLIRATRSCSIVSFSVGYVVWWFTCSK